MRHLLVVLGDQLDSKSDLLQAADPEQDAVWMAEVDQENTHVWCHQQRIVFFLSAMRHLRNALQQQGLPVHYHELSADQAQDRGRSFYEILRDDLSRLSPQKVRVVQPGDVRVLQQLQRACHESRIELEVVDDSHFLCSPSEFSEWASGRKTLVMEHFYRWMRRRHNVLMEDDGQPTGSQWNFDHDNRESPRKMLSDSGRGSSAVPSGKSARSLFADASTDQPRTATGVVEPLRFSPDDITTEVMRLVEVRFADHPGRLETFSLPVTRDDALTLLEHFVRHQLPNFGRLQDAMWTDLDFLNHSRLSAAINVHLLSPKEVIDAAVSGYHDNNLPLNSVEGFVRQILGWREFVRGVYFLRMPEYTGLNFLKHDRPVPSFFWNGQTTMNCVRRCMTNVLNNAYAHHIQRLMVLGNFAQLWGTNPLQFHEWHMAMYCDAIDWVSLPNTVGMSQYGDGGIVGTKPYCSSGNYIHRMSNYCDNCHFDYRQRTGDQACPFTTLYWHFLDRHHDQLKDNGRMKLAMKNLVSLRSDPKQIAAIRERAEWLFEHLEAMD